MDSSSKFNIELENNDAAFISEQPFDIRANVKTSCNLILDNIALIASTAIKNKKLGANLLSHCSAIFTNLKALKPTDLQSLWWGLSCLRDLSRKVFHGSVVADLLDLSSDLQVFNALVDSVNKAGAGLIPAGVKELFSAAQTI